MNLSVLIAQWDLCGPFFLGFGGAFNTSDPQPCPARSADLRLEILHFFFSSLEISQSAGVVVWICGVFLGCCFCVNDFTKFFLDVLVDF